MQENILCISTAFRQAMLALKTEKNVSYRKLDASAKSSENVLLCVDELLGKAGIEVGNLTHICIVVGPGSFTGLRVGVSLVKGICAVFKNIKICALSSLEMQAFEWQKNVVIQPFCVVQNALSGRFFVQEFDENGQKITEASLVRNLPDCLKIGLSEEGLSEVSEYVTISPEALLGFSEFKLRKGEFTSAEALSPVYLRLSQAEENLLVKTEE